MAFLILFVIALSLASQQRLHTEPNRLVSVNLIKPQKHRIKTAEIRGKTR
jgi:hypothetical protein